MTEPSPIRLSTGLPETVLPPIDPSIAERLSEATGLSGAPRLAALQGVAADHPACLQAWAALAEVARTPVEAYAYARVGYHRGLDQLRAAGWRGSGFVRWREPSNQGFLRSLDALRAAAGTIGESGEEERCALFLRQLDPSWDTVRPQSAGEA